MIESSTQVIEKLSQRIKVWVASDHAGFELKELALARLRSNERFDVYDQGPFDAERVDYPQYAWPLALSVAASLDRGESSFGILICGTGIGVSLVANKHPRLRAALAHNLFTAEMARRHNDAQVLCLGARVIGRDLALAMIDRFLETPFDGGRHTTRLELMRDLTADK